MVEKSDNVFWQKTNVTKTQRQGADQYKPFILWFTGLSGAGKTSLASKLEKILHDKGVRTYILDGDNMRHGLNKDLGFSNEDRKENIRRVGEVAKLMLDAGIVVLTSFISPFQEDRQTVRSIVENDEFIEVFVKCPLEICEKRDPKGLYKKARKGEIKHFTGVDSDYEEPKNPEIVLNTGEKEIDDCVVQLLDFIENKKILNRPQS